MKATRIAAALLFAAAGAASMAADTAKVGTFPLVDADTQDPVLKPIFDGMKARGAGPLHIHRTIGHAPEIYKGFAAFATALRQPGDTTRGERELIILRTLQLKGGDYEFVQHRRIGLTCGLSEQEVDNLAAWRDKPFYSDRRRLILEYADAMLSSGTVGDPVMLRVKAEFSPKAIVELTMNSAFYTSVTQFTQAVRIEPETVVTSYAGC